MAHQSADLPANNDGSRVWVPSIVSCIARFLSANEVACILRLVDKLTSQQFASCKTMRLSLPSPIHVFMAFWGRPGSFRGYTRKQRLKLLCLTAASGSIANLGVALDNTGLVVGGSELLEAAAEAGQLDVCKMLRACGCPWGGSLAAAARGGHRHVCEWMLASGCSSCYYEAVDTAARSGHEGLMVWLMMYQVVQPTDMGSLLCAAADGLSLASFQQLHQQLPITRQQQQGDEAQQQQQQGDEAQQQQQGDEAQQQQQQGDEAHQQQQGDEAQQQQQGDEAQQQQQQQQPADQVLSEDQQSHILAAAAGSPTPDWQAKVEWLEGQGCPRTPQACSSAAACSADEEAVSRLQWLCSRGFTPDEHAVIAAAGCGNLSALRFLVEQAGVRPDRQASYAAAIGGYLAVLQYLHTVNGLLLEPVSLTRTAAEEGHLPVVAWAMEALSITPRIIRRRLLNSAAESGSLELLTWLRDQCWMTCWGRHNISNAAWSGCVEAVEWLVEQGCPWPEDGSAYTTAGRLGDLAMIRCMHRLGCPWGPNQMVDWIKHISPSLVPVLRCFLELGCPVDWDEVMRAADERHAGEMPGEELTALLTWLGEERQRQLLGAAAAVAE